MYYLYIVQCKDRSLYTGITTDVARRIKEHNGGNLGAKYTKAKGPVRLVYMKEYPDRSTVSVEEARVKGLSRDQKIRFIKNGRKEYLKNKRESKKDRRGGYLKNKEEARRVIVKDVERVNKFYGFKYNNISIRNTSTRWGSCSSKKNLNFSFQLLFVTPEEREYVVAHELCHLQEMNHSQNFWSLVEKFCPSYKNIRAKLRSRKMLNEF